MHMLGVAYVASALLGPAGVVWILFWILVGKDVFLVDVGAGAIDIGGYADIARWPVYIMPLFSVPID